MLHTLHELTTCKQIIIKNNNLQKIKTISARISPKSHKIRLSCQTTHIFLFKIWNNLSWKKLRCFKHLHELTTCKIEEPCQFSTIMRCLIISFKMFNRWQKNWRDDKTRNLNSGCTIFPIHSLKKRNHIVK